MTSELLTTTQVAELLQVPVSTIYDWRASRRSCPPAIRVGRHLRWRRTDVDEWLAARTG